MGNPSSIQMSVWICLAGITGVPFYFQNWLERTKPILAVNVQNQTTRLSTLIFVLLFTGGFVFNRQSQGAAMVLLFAAVISFSFLYQFAGRYQLSLNRRPTGGRTSRHHDSSDRAAHVASLRKNFARLLVGGILCLLMSKFSLLILALPLIIPFAMPLFVRLQHSCQAMADSDLKNKLLGRFKEEGIPLANLYLIDDPQSSVKNAFITGSPLARGAFGQTLFITLPLIQELDEAELLAVTFHEAAHARLRHGTSRLFASVGLMILSAFWITLPVAFLLPKNLVAIAASILVAVFAQAFLLSKVISKQEHEADLLAVRLGTSSDALIRALQKLRPATEGRSPLLRVLSGNLYPTHQARIDAILACEVPGSTRLFKNPASVLAYSMLVMGVVLWAAHVRTPPANVSYSEEAIVSR